MCSLNRQIKITVNISAYTVYIQKPSKSFQKFWNYDLSKISHYMVIYVAS